MTSFSNSLAPLEGTGFPVQSIARILHAALHAADPFECVERNLDCTAQEVRVGGKTYLLYPDSRVFTVAIGKASLKMLEAAWHVLGNTLAGGVCVCKHNTIDSTTIGRVEILQGSHPVPDQSSVDAAIKIKQTLFGLSSHDLVLLLISGGGSALVCLPAEGVTLGDIQSVTSALLSSGASINEMNTVRKHLDLIKGGGLLNMSAPAQVAALVISDVVNSPLDVIASGPAVPDPSTFQDAAQILKRYLSANEIPIAVMERINQGCQGQVAETLKPEDELAHLATHTIIASNQVSAEAALKTAHDEGFQAEILTCELVGEARLAGEKLTDWLTVKDTMEKPYVGIAGGETTVKVRGQGLGGRNLEVALGAVKKMERMKKALVVTLATDGEDGPTDAAGAFVTSDTSLRARQFGLDEEQFLANNDAYHFFEKVGGLIRTGPSGTNVNDLNFIFRF